MLNRLLKLFGPNKVQLTPQVIPATEHEISRQQVSHGALKVIDRLQSAGFTAYLVGGGVRDTMLGGHPKDFDVATSATPEEVVSTFRSARIIGRRFRIVHVRFGREIIEVTTFRGRHDAASSSGQASRSKQGLLLRDNVYGDIESDALRRDFTVNALYYEPNKEELFDFVQGVADLESRILRIIGNARERYQEDPVRMLRAVRFSAKLGFKMDPQTETPLHEMAELLSHVPPARLFEEVLKLFMNGSASATFNLLEEHGLLQYLFPGTVRALEDGREIDRALITQALINTDTRIRQGKRVTPAFLYAAFLWPQLSAAMVKLVDEQKLSEQDALQLASQGVVSQQLAHTSIPKRFLIPMREIWLLQLRLPRRDGRRAYGLLDHPRFRAAYDFLLLREDAGEDLGGLGMWWTRFQSADESEREAMVKALGGAGKGRRKRRNPRRRKPPSQTD
jgi:poly(A) polymerase